MDEQICEVEDEADFDPFASKVQDDEEVESVCTCSMYSGQAWTWLGHGPAMTKVVPQLPRLGLPRFKGRGSCFSTGQGLRLVCSAVSSTLGAKPGLGVESHRPGWPDHGPWVFALAWCPRRARGPSLSLLSMPPLGESPPPLIVDVKPFPQLQ
ncbi:hypothetical protein Sjap_024771 [Stephania japonica]|uniref:Uncharacterized protein n=1 Tax=Stephania japonica TaxID=461633 RepID=A0AAP0EE63_9MAGN